MYILIADNNEQVHRLDSTDEVEAVLERMLEEGYPPDVELAVLVTDAPTDKIWKLMNKINEGVL